MTDPAVIGPGDIRFATLDPATGREQAGRRPVLVVASERFLEVVDALAIVVPITSIDRGWPNHVPLRGLDRPSFAMTEQIRTISRDPSRLHGLIGHATDEELAAVQGWLASFLGLPHRE